MSFIGLIRKTSIELQNFKNLYLRSARRVYHDLVYSTFAIMCYTSKFSYPFVIRCPSDEYTHIRGFTQIY